MERWVGGWVSLTGSNPAPPLAMCISVSLFSTPLSNRGQTLVGPDNHTGRLEEGVVGRWDTN